VSAAAVTTARLASGAATGALVVATGALVVALL
jgi:hypothetical protein